MIEAVEKGLVEEFIPHPAIETFHGTVLHGLARFNETPIHSASRAQANIPFDVSSVP